MWLGPPLHERGNRVTETLAGPAQSPAAHTRPPPPSQMPVLCLSHKPLLLLGPPERPPPATRPAQRVSKLFSEHFEVSWAPPPVPGPLPSSTPLVLKGGGSARPPPRLPPASMSIRDVDPGLSHRSR